MLAKSAAVPSNRIQRWTRDAIAHEKEDGDARERNEHNEPVNSSRKKGSGTLDASSEMRYEAYMALLDHRIRNAYVGILTLQCIRPH